MILRYMTQKCKVHNAGETFSSCLGIQHPRFKVGGTLVSRSSTLSETLSQNSNTANNKMLKTKEDKLNNQEKIRA